MNKSLTIIVRSDATVWLRFEYPHKCYVGDTHEHCTIVSQPSKCLKFMTFRDILSYAIECKHLVKLLRLSITINFTKDEDNISQLGDYDAPFCEQQYTHGSCYISLFKFKSFNQLIPPKLL